MFRSSQTEKERPAMNKYDKKRETFADSLRDFNHARYGGVPSYTMGGFYGAIRREQNLAAKRQKEEEEQRLRGDK